MSSPTRAHESQAGISMPPAPEICWTNMFSSICGQDSKMQHSRDEQIFHNFVAYLTRKFIVRKHFPIVDRLLRTRALSTGQHVVHYLTIYLLLERFKTSNGVGPDSFPDMLFILTMT